MQLREVKSSPLVYKLPLVKVNDISGDGHLSEREMPILDGGVSGDVKDVLVLEHHMIETW